MAKILYLIICIAVFYIFIILSYLNGVYSVCPINTQIFEPCRCINDTIYCSGKSSISLSRIFHLLRSELPDNQKHFRSLLLNNTAISEIRDNTFKDITFDRIDITYCNNLSKIYANAFSTTSYVTTVVKIIGNK